MRTFLFNIHGNKYKVTIDSIIKKGEKEIILLELNGKKLEVEIEGEEVKTPTVIQKKVPQTILERLPITSSGGHVDLNKVKAPIPGIIVDVYKKLGDTVKKGDVVLVLEAMKMRNDIQATQDGTIKELNVKKGDSVLEGDVLFVIE